MTAFAMISAMAYHSKSIMLVSKFCHGAVRNSWLLQQHKLQHLAVKSLLSRNSSTGIGRIRCWRCFMTSALLWTGWASGWAGSSLCWGYGPARYDAVLDNLLQAVGLGSFLGIVLL